MATNFNYIYNFGSSGTGNTNFSSPTGLDFDGKYVYVVDSGNSRVVKRALKGGAFKAKTDYSFSPSDVLVIGNKLFVTDATNGKVYIFLKSNLSFIKDSGISVTTPMGICQNNDEIFIVDQGDTKVKVFDKKTLSLSRSKNIVVVGDQICYDKDEDAIYIGSVASSKVVKHLATGGMRKLGEIASLTNPYGVVVNDYFLYVTQTNTITAYDTTTLTSRGSTGQAGTDNDDISDGRYIISFSDSIMFTDAGNHRVNIWQNFVPDRSTVPDSLAIDNQTEVFGWDEEDVLAATDADEAAASPINRWVETPQEEENFNWEESS